MSGSTHKISNGLTWTDMPVHLACPVRLSDSCGAFDDRSRQNVARGSHALEDDQDYLVRSAPPCHGGGAQRAQAGSFELADPAFLDGPYGDGVEVVQLLPVPANGGDEVRGLQHAQMLGR